MTDINILFSIQEVSLNEIFQNNPNNLILLPSVSFGIIHLLSNGNLTHACIFVNNLQLLYNDISLCKMNGVAMFISFTNQILSN
jgi:hypothetical protein